MAEIKKLHSQLADNQKLQLDKDENFLRQLSTLDFATMQRESYSKRHANTGQWLLEGADFQTWLQSEDGQNSVLWYQGDPGVGKTVFTSIAVNHVTEKIGDRTPALVYIYCHYANDMTFAVENLLGSIVRQLIEQASHAETVAELKTFLSNPARNRKMTKDDTSSWIEVLFRNFGVVYVFVDALDECPEDDRDELLRRLQRYSLGNVRVLLTSRSNVDVKSLIPRAKKVVIAAAIEDITAYVESKIRRNGRLTRLTARNPELKSHIMSTVCSQANGMFLLARLQVETLGYQTSARGVRSALESLPTDIFTIYDQAVERIRSQPKEDAELGWKVVSMIFGATRPLLVDELRHALATKPGDTYFDSEALTDTETLFSVTVGLVTTYLHEDGQRSCRFVHYTLHEYFKSNRERLFPDLDLLMARACLLYLSLDDFGSNNVCVNGCRYRQEDEDKDEDKDEDEDEDEHGSMRKRKVNFCFLEYASQNWAYHLRTVQRELMDQSLVFVTGNVKTAAWLQCFDYFGVGIRLSADEDLPLDPAFLAARFHLSELFRRLISHRDINTRNSRGQTPLIQAANIIPYQKWRMIGPSCLNFRDEKTWRTGAEPWFVRSLDTDQLSTIQVMLNLNADIDAKDETGMTAAFYAVMRNNGGILSFLLDHGANIEARRKNGESLLHIALLHITTLDILQLLLDRSANPNAIAKDGASVVHVAAECGCKTKLTRLLDHGAHPDIADNAGATPLLVAARLNRPHMVKMLIQQGADPGVTDFKGRTLLHLAVSSVDLKWTYSHRAYSIPDLEIFEIAMRRQRIDVLDFKGRTPLHHAYFRSSQVLASEQARMAYFAVVIERLIEGGASETIVDSDGRIPRDYSSWTTDEDVLKWSGDYRTASYIHESEEDAETNEDSGSDEDEAEEQQQSN